MVPESEKIINPLQNVAKMFLLIFSRVFFRFLTIKGNCTIKFKNQNPFFSKTTNFFDLKPVPFFKLGLPLSESALPFLKDLPKIGPLTWELAAFWGDPP
jgi:hypothetical protein